MNEKYMEIALKEAEKAYKKGDIPVGAVIVKDDKVISRAYNKKERDKNAIKHAEIIAIEKACKKLKTWHLEDCVLYTTLEPCMMCCGAIMQSRIRTLVYGTTNAKFGYVESMGNLLTNDKNNHKVSIISGIKKDESSELLISFFKNKRN